MCPAHIKYHFYSSNAKDYIAENFGFTETDMTVIDWESPKGLNKTLYLHKQVTHAKYVYRWNYTHAQAYLFGDNDTETCPLCEVTHETSTHTHTVVYRNNNMIVTQADTIEVLKSIIYPPSKIVDWLLKDFLQCCPENPVCC